MERFEIRKALKLKNWKIWNLEDLELEDWKIWSWKVRTGSKRRKAGSRDLKTRQNNRNT
nr:hypothetical protein [uncultured Prevotella sp.]